MLVTYDWLASSGDAPGIGTWLELSGDPDRPVLRGAVARHEDDEDGITRLYILMADRQNGSTEFQQWLIDGGDLGIAVAADQSGLPVV